MDTLQVGVILELGVQGGASGGAQGEPGSPRAGGVARHSPRRGQPPSPAPRSAALPPAWPGRGERGQDAGEGPPSGAAPMGDLLSATGGALCPPPPCVGGPGPPARRPAAPAGLPAAGRRRGAPGSRRRPAPARSSWWPPAGRGRWGGDRRGQRAVAARWGPPGRGGSPEPGAGAEPGPGAGEAARRPSVAATFLRRGGGSGGGVVLGPPGDTAGDTARGAPTCSLAARAARVPLGR